MTRHRKFRACPHKAAFCKRGSVNVRFAPKATEVLRCRKASLCAKTGLMHCSNERAAQLLAALPPKASDRESRQ